MPVTYAGLSAVVYAKDLDRVGAFYAAVLDIAVPARDGSYLLLESGAVHLVVLEMPAPLARDIVVTDPPERRTDTAVKLVFPVDSIARIREVADSLGGTVDSERHEWRFQDTRVCDGHDPEGNVIQLREPF